MLQVDPGKELMRFVSEEMENHKACIRLGWTEIHRDQAIVEILYKTMAERLFNFQYREEMVKIGRSAAWFKRLPQAVASLNNEETR